ncbi:MAG: cupin domain-containing protein [Anaerolineae bacterium]|nr:cupin domain-containing protein [Anaerolineae bacterium]
MALTAQDIIELLRLVPLEAEGGLYRQTYKSADAVPVAVLPSRYRAYRSFGTAIYYLLTPGVCSTLHRLLTDEVYHFYLGDPVEMLWLNPDGTSQMLTLGQDIAGGQHVQLVVPHGVWQGSYLKPGGAYALMGTTMAPGFEPEDFEPGVRVALIAQYPDRAGLITRLTR